MMVIAIWFMIVSAEPEANISGSTSKNPVAAIHGIACDILNHGILVFDTAEASFATVMIHAFQTGPAVETLIPAPSAGKAVSGRSG